MSGTSITVNEQTQVRLDAVFRPAGSDIPFDPPTVKLLVRAPGAPTPTPYTYGQPGSPIVRLIAGEYRAFFVVTSPGSWWFTWQGVGGTGPIVVGEMVIHVKNAVNV